VLKNKDRELQESLIKFNKFLQDNDSKRNRAEKKEKEEIKQRVVKEHEIVKLNEELRKQKEKRQRMMQELDKMMKYHLYLECVLDTADEFAEISDLLSRYDTLEAANLDLVSRSQQADSQQEQQRYDLQLFIREKTDEILGYNNKIAELQKMSEKTAEATLEEQANSERHMSTVAERKLQFGQVMMACENIYQRCCDRSSVQRKKLQSAASDEDEVEVIRVIIEKLMFIRDYVLDLSSITKGFRPLETKAGSPRRPDMQPSSTSAAAANISVTKTEGGVPPPASSSAKPLAGGAAAGAGNSSSGCCGSNAALGAEVSK